MASALYDEMRRSIGGIPTHSVIDLNDDAISVFFVDEADDTPSQASDQDAADRASAAQVPAFASAPALAGAGTRVTIASNLMVFDAADVTFTALTGDQVESYDYFKDTGTDSTSPMIANFDDATGLPLTPSGGDVVLVHHANGIFRI